MSEKPASIMVFFEYKQNKKNQVPAYKLTEALNIDCIKNARYLRWIAGLSGRANLLITFLGLWIICRAYGTV